jgi:cell division septum initiation protein DivIVA
LGSPAGKEVPLMSAVDIGLFGPPSDEEELHPDFNKVLLGFDPRHVEEFVAQVEERIGLLEKKLRDTRSHLEAANRRAATAREEAYGEVAARMAELLRAADQQAEKLRRETEEAVSRRLGEATQQADQIRRESEVQADALRAQGESELAEARAECRRVLSELARHRDAVIGELQALRLHLIGLVDRVESAVEPPARNGMSPDPTPMAPMAPGVDDLLDSTEGFELAPMKVWDEDEPLVFDQDMDPVEDQPMVDLIEIPDAEENGSYGDATTPAE